MRGQKAQAPINFAVVGCDMLARRQHVPNIARSNRAILHTCCDLGTLRRVRVIMDAYGVPRTLYSNRLHRNSHAQWSRSVVLTMGRGLGTVLTVHGVVRERR